MNAGIFGGFYRGCEWITRLAYLNILWILFTVVGLVVFGLFPATAATFAVTRKWQTGDTELPIFKTFWEAYREEFKQANYLGFILFLIGFFLYFDLRFAQSQTGFFHIFKFFFLGLLFFYYVMLLYVFPVFSHYQMKTLEYIKHAFILALGRPLQSILMIIGSVVVTYLMMFIPGLIPVYSVSLMSLILTWGAFLSFPKVVEE